MSPHKAPKRSLRRSLGQFIMGNGLLSLMLAVYLGSTMNTFFSSLVTGAVVPLIAIVIKTFRGEIGTNNDQVHMTKWVANVRGAKIYYGIILSNFIQLMISIYIAYLFVNYFVIGYLNH